MCGIAGIHVKERYIGEVPIDSLADHLLLGIEKRGRDATGYLAVGADGRSVKLEKKDINASRFIHGRSRIPDETKTLLLHTRAQTQGPAKDNENNHPVVYGSCFATHNGVIYNDDRVFQELGLERNAAVDSIAIPAALTYHGMGEISDIKAGLNQLEGWMAIAAVDPVKAPGRLVLAKGLSSPLIVINHKKFIMWASLSEAIQNAWGACLGTPSKKWATASNGYQGFYSFGNGELWVIDGDQITKDRFQLPAARRSASSGTGFCNRNAPGHYYCGVGYCVDDDYEDTWGDHSTNPQENLRKSWTCSPSYTDCVHACSFGCLDGRCTCYVGCKNHPFVPDWLSSTDTYKWWREMRNMPDNGTARNLSLVQGVSTDGLSPTAQSMVERAAASVLNAEEGSEDTTFECDGCLEFFDKTELDYEAYGNETFLLCDTCRGDLSCSISGRAKEIEAPAEEATEGEQVDWEDTASIDPYLAKSRENNHLHQRACLEVAYELDTTVAFVDWILFRCPKKDIEDDDFLKKMREDVIAEYRNGYQIAKSVWEMV